MKWYASKKMVSFVILIFLSAVFSGFFFVKALVFDKPQTSTYVAEDGTVYERTNILLLGIDARPGETRSRTDTIILVSIDPKSRSVALLSIPRDTLVKIPGHGEDKINAANAYGGPELTKQVVEKLTGVPIAYHVMTNFEGFKDIIDTLGGVTLDVEKNMVYKNEGIRLEKGLQKLNGDKALQYVRFRSDAMGDIGRTQRQQSFLKAIADEALKLKTIVKLPKLVPQISKVVDTNMSVAEMAHIANLAKKIDINKLVTQTLPGNFYNYKGISYWKVADSNVKAFVLALLTNGETANIIDNDVVNKPSQPERKKQVDNSPTKPVGEAPSNDKDDASTGNTGTGDSGTVSPDTGDPGTVKPVTGDPGTGNPDTVNPGTVNPSTGDPGTGNPDTGDPGTVSPGMGDPDIVNPGTDNTKKEVSG